MLNILIIGSNFLSALAFVSACSFNNAHIYIMDRKDPIVLLNYNQTARERFQQYCKGYTYKNSYDLKGFGDPKRKLKITWLFYDWVNNRLEYPLEKMDIILHTGSIYDTKYASVNKKDVMNVNIGGMYNVLSQLGQICGGRSEPDKSKNPLFVHFSSINVYGDQTNKMEKEITEDVTVPNPKDLLNFTLYTQENMVKSLCHEADVDYLILRLGTMTGDYTPMDNLTNSALIAVLRGDDKFEINNAENSIDLLDSRDFESLVMSLIHSYLEQSDEKWDSIVNQVYNIKAEEPQEKTVESVVKSMYALINSLPAITKDHAIPKVPYLKLKAPKLRYTSSGLLQRKPTIKFDKPVSSDKAREMLKFLSNKPIIMALVPHTVNFLINNVIGEKQMSDNEKQAVCKILNIPYTPRPETLREDTDKELKAAVEDINKQIKRDMDQ